MTSSQSNKGREWGFTLLEIMIVLVIISGIVSIAITQLGGSKRYMRKEVAEISQLSRNIFYQARLKNRVYRMVIKMEEKKKHLYWVESSASVTTLPKPGSENEKIPENDEEKKDSPEQSFQPDSYFMKKPKEVPPPLIFSDVEVVGRGEPIKEGLAYIYFLPQGVVELAALHLTDGAQLNWTLVLHPLTGKTRILTRKVSLKELKNQ